MHIQYREICFSLVVFEDPQIGYFFSKKLCLFLPIAMTNPQ